ncbi:hypothetical protein [Streptomyces zaomyceticus]|uniref:hypothetical protein n=1 Tax=Streptomyces zaomyceticus TaxID=68286 RepID=UPI0033B9D600
MDIVRAERLNAFDTHIRSEGVYAILGTGRLTWDDSQKGDWEPSTWQAHGALIHLMEGRTLIAACKLEVPPTDADERATAAAREIEPWAETLLHLAAARRLRDELLSADRLRNELLTELEYEELPSDDLMERMTRHSTRDDVLVVQAELGAAKPQEGAHYVRLMEVIADRYRREIARAQRIALAHAPDFATHPIHPAWVLPASLSQEEEGLAQVVAQELLVGWRGVQGLRDSLVTWSIHEVGLTRGRVQEISSVSRTTINRLLPSEG